jgi:hypothetical protein
MDAGGCHAGARRWRRDDPRASGRCGYELIGGRVWFCALSMITDEIGICWSGLYGM